MGLRGKEEFFFEKKNQKTFTHGVRDSMDKSFLLLFFKKEVLAYNPPPPRLSTIGAPHTPCVSD
jgi:hypothetical protein